MEIRSKDSADLGAGLVGVFPVVAELLLVTSSSHPIGTTTISYALKGLVEKA